MGSAFRVLTWEHPKKLERERTKKCCLAYRAWGYVVERICRYAGKRVYAARRLTGIGHADLWFPAVWHLAVGCCFHTLYLPE